MIEKEERERTTYYIDLHLHLDGAITLPIARRLAAIQNLSLPKDDEELLKKLSLPDDCKSLDDFLKCFGMPLSLLQTREGISEAVYLVQENIRSQNVIYAELRFAPQLHLEKGLTQRQVIQAALEGLGRSELACNLILCCMRGANNQAANEETVDLAAEFLVETGGVVAVDLAGAEAPFPTEDYKQLFARARERKIPFTIHAGEAAGPESVLCAIEMGASRIGHGVRSFEDEAVVKMLKERQIPLEMCPISNLRTCALREEQAYPLKYYLEMGIMATLNTDDPAILKNTLKDEFCYVREQCGITPEQERQLLLNSAEAAFTDRKTKELLREKLVKTAANEKRF